MRIMIVGAGKMGRWFGEVLKYQHEVAIHDIDKAKMGHINGVIKMESISECSEFEPEILINAVNIQNTISVFNEVLQYLSHKCIISDITSVKTGMEEFYKNTGRRFVSTHPMFGPTFSDFNNLEGENAIIMSESDEEGKGFFYDLYHSFGINIHEFTFDEHDRTIAYCLSMPFISTMVFSACLKQQKAPGTTFRRHMEIAKRLLSEDDKLLTEILFNPHTLRHVEEISGKLSYLIHIIREKDHEEMGNFINRIRRNIIYGQI